MCIDHAHSNFCAVASSEARNHPGAHSHTRQNQSTHAGLCRRAASRLGPVIRLVDTTAPAGAVRATPVQRHRNQKSRLQKRDAERCRDAAHHRAPVPQQTGLTCSARRRWTTPLPACPTTIASAGIRPSSTTTPTACPVSYQEPHPVTTTVKGHTDMSPHGHDRSQFEDTPFRTHTSTHTTYTWGATRTHTAYTHSAHAPSNSRSWAPTACPTVRRCCLRKHPPSYASRH